MWRTKGVLLSLRMQLRLAKEFDGIYGFLVCYIYVYLQVYYVCAYNLLKILHGQMKGKKKRRKSMDSMCSS